MESTKGNARRAGLLYLLLIATAPIGLVYVPGKLIVTGNATATASNILASQALFRIGIVGGLVAAVVFIFLGLALYRLLQGVNQRHALLMAVLAMMQVPIAFLNEVNSLAALMLVRGEGFLTVFEKPQRDALAMLFLNLHNQGVIVCEVFWGLWLIPFGLLVFRSGFIPRVLGVWLNINGLAYVAISATGLLFPQNYRLVSGIAFPALLGEMAIVPWLLAVGARDRTPRPARDPIG